LGSALKFLFESEVSEKVVRFLRTRGQRARIVAPHWVRDRVMAGASREEAANQASWTETPGAPAPQLDGAWNYIVLARDAERERAQMAQLQRHKGIKVFGMFRDVLPALLCGSAGLTRGHQISDVKRYAVLCLPRCGSRYLASMLNRAGLGIPLEHLREPLAAVMTDGGLGFDAGIETLERFGQRNGIFGTKLISTFLIKACSGSLSELERNIGWMVERGYQFVHIERPLNDAMISSYIAARLNQWHFFEHIDETIKSHLDELVFDEKAAWNEYVRFRAQKLVVDHIVHKFGFQTFSYDDVQTDIGRIVDYLGARLDVEPENLQSGSASVPVPTRPQSQTYEIFTSALNDLLEKRTSDVAPHTIGQLTNLVGIDEETAGQIAGKRKIVSAF
jgi:LPS sulfotransferase NodH